MKGMKVMRDTKLYVSKSNIHGKGLHATRFIRKGTYLGEYLGIPTKRNSKYVLWVGDLGLLVKNNMKYINHSSDPNAELINTKCYARKNIKKDEEIFIFYSKEFDKGKEVN